MPGVLLLIAVIGLGIFGFLTVQTSEVNRESYEMRSYLNSPETARQLQEASTAESEAQSMSARAERVAAPMEMLATYPDLTSADYARILGFASANIEIGAMSYDRSTGVLRFIASSEYVLSIPTFIALMRQSGMFTHVSYSGYASTVQPMMPIIQATTTYLDMGGAYYGLHLDAYGTAYDPSDYYYDSNTGYNYPYNPGSTSGGITGGGTTGTTGGTSGGSSVTYTQPLYSFSVECIVKPPQPGA